MFDAMSMTLEDSFLEDIIAHPDDDAPRLVFADWLEENGQPARGEFIRRQIGAARLSARAAGAALSADEERQLEEEKARADALLEGQGRGWDARVRRHLVGYRYQRGFIEHVTLTATLFLSQGKTLFAQAPIRQVRLEHGGKRVEEIAASPLLAALTGLELAYWRMEEAGVAELLAAPRLSGLTTLSLRCNNIGDHGVALVAGSPYLAGLTHLDLGHNDVYVEGAVALAGSPHLHCLRQLDLHFNELRQAGVAALARAPLLEPVQELDLGFNEITDDGALMLAGAPGVPLTRLVLSHSELTDAGVRALCLSSRLISQLRHLELQFNAIDNEGARILATAGLTHLRRLDLSKNRIGAGGTRALAAAPDLAGLTHLDLESNPIGDLGAAALVASPHLGRLVRLTLGSSNVSLSGREALRERFGDRLSWYGDSGG